MIADIHIGATFTTAWGNALFEENVQEKDFFCPFLQNLSMNNVPSKMLKQNIERHDLPKTIVECQWEMDWLL